MRLFFGVPVSEELRTFYKNFIEPELEAHVIGKAVEPENLHITMLFLGDISDVGFISTIASDLSTFLPFEVTVGGYNFFGHPPRVFFMDVIKGKSELNAIHDCLCTGTGLNDPRFSPHVTLARIKYSNTAIHNIINKLPSDNFTWTVNKIVLFESKLTNKGPIYSVYEEFPLKAL